MSECEHTWKVDEFFESGAVMMFSGPIDDVKREMRYICKKCGEVKYE